MYQNLVNQNPMINQFAGYMAQNPVPFLGNQLLNNNPHVVSNLTDLLQQHRAVQNNIPMYQQQLNIPLQQQQQCVLPQQPLNFNNNSSNNNKPKNSNIIEEMLKPQKIKKDAASNKDVASNYKVRKEIQKSAKKNINIKMTNAPYKSIIKDKIVTKNVEDVLEEDLLVHKSIRQIDANREKFDQELEVKEAEKEKINDELKIEFHIDNYDKHKKKFEYKETFIKNLAFEENTFDQNKQDYIEFYRQKQKEAEEGQKLCDQILHNIFDEGIISKDELPTEDTADNKEIDLKSVINNMDTEELNPVPSKKSKIVAATKNKHNLPQKPTSASVPKNPQKSTNSLKNLQRAKKNPVSKMSLSRKMAEATDIKQTEK